MCLVGPNTRPGAPRTRCGQQARQIGITGTEHIGREARHSGLLKADRLRDILYNCASAKSEIGDR
jgi:hypothetical protein